MVFRRETVEQRLKELDEILQELGKHRDLSAEELQVDIDPRQVGENLQKALRVFPRFVHEIQTWIHTGGLTRDERRGRWANRQQMATAHLSRRLFA
jgi:hypothetical protein